MALFKFHDNSLLASLDIGSSAIRCAVFQKSADFPLELLSWAEQKTSGFEDFRIIHFEDFCQALGSVLNQAEERGGCSFSEVWPGFSPPFHSFRSQGMAILSDREVRERDLSLAVETACAVPLPEGHVRLHSFPESFCVDGRDRVLNPLGLSGLRLETQARLVSAPRFYCQDIIKALKLLGWTPKAFFHNLIALGQNLTTPQQKQNGVCFCDIGYKSSRLLVFLDGQIEVLFSIPLGGWHFSFDLSSQFNISVLQADFLKETKARLFSKSHKADEESIELEGESLYLSRKLFIQTLEKTAERLLQKIKSSLSEKNIMGKIQEGFIFTGGTACIPGFSELAGFVLGKPARPPQNLYENFKQTNALALIQQAYLENKLTKQSFSSNPFVWRELF